MKATSFRSKAMVDASWKNASHRGPAPAKNQPIVEFENLALRYDDLFSRSRIGTQRGIVWEVLADIFRPGDAILVLNCRTRKDESFLALLDVPVVACDVVDDVMHAELRSGRTF